MSDELWVGTRKGLFRYDRTGTGWQMRGTPAFLAQPVTAFCRDPRDGALYVSLQHGHFGCKFHRSLDDGATWEEFATPAYPVSDDPEALALEMIWVLTPGAADQPGVIWAGTIPGGLFRSADRGESWEMNDALWNQPSRPGWFGGGFDHAGIHSILIDPRDSNHMIVGISCASVWITRDGGQSWEIGGRGFEAKYLPPERAFDPTGQDPHLISFSPVNPDRIWCQHHCGIYSSDDFGATWTEYKDVKPSVFGFGVAVHPHDPDTAWFVPGVVDAVRVPVDAKFVVTRTRDGGKSFEILDKGLPQGPAYDLCYRHAFVVDGTGERLAMGSTTGNFWVSENGGDAWQMISGHLPPIAVVAFGA